MKNLQVNFSKVNSGSPIVIKLDGNLTSMNAMNFKKDTINLLMDEKQDLHIDISDLKSMDVAGVNALAMTHKAAERNGCKMVLMGDSEYVAHEFFHLSKFQHCFHFKVA